jgi:hypothetical protein
MTTSCMQKLRFILIEFLFTSFGLLLTASIYAQSEIPLGTWRIHLSYNNITSIALAHNQVYGATKNGILIFNKEDKSLSSYNKLNALSSSTITHIAFDNTTNQLLVAHEDGSLDIVQDNTMTNFLRLKNSNTISGSKKINHITVKENLAYLSADFGVVVFDLQKQEIKETWRDLGAAGGSLKIRQSLFLSDSIILATEKGILIGNIHDNLLDFTSWKRFDQGAFNNSIEAIGVFQQTLFAAIDGNGIYHYENGDFVLENFLQTADFHSLQGSAHNLLITESTNIWRLNPSGQLIQVADQIITAPQFAIEESAGVYWVADQEKGLISNEGGGFVSYLPNGPSSENVFRLAFTDNRMYALQGGFTTSGNALNREGELNYFFQGKWQMENTGLNDLTDVVNFNNKRYLSFFGAGLQEQDASSTTILIDDTNSPLQNINPTGKAVNISAMEISDGGLWMVNYGADKPIHLLKNNNTWQSYLPGVTLSKFAVDLAVDFYENLWMIINPSQGGGVAVLNPQNGNMIYKNEIAGAGALPSNTVLSLALDLEGNIWIGTDAGVAYFFSEKNDAVKPIFENRFLLRDEKITAIAVDGGNRKWLGTEKGVWLVSPSGEELIYNFTAENSPLLSNNIRDIEINSETGEVFFATDQGVLSFRGDATVNNAPFKAIKIFPNPVTKNFSGTIGIEGFAMGTDIKITDVSGKLIWQTRTNGGTATWNVHDYNGRRATTGIYLVFAATQDGAERAVGKIAVID